MDRISRLAWAALLLGLASIPGSAQSAGAINVVPGLDLSGNWAPAIHEDFPERIPGPELVNYLGLPITEGARMFAESWDASRLTLPEHQCQVHVAPYIYRGPLNLHIWEEKDPQSQRVIAIKNYISTYEQTRTIWMDGRPHPSEYAPHTFMGFSTGKWEGPALTVTTTHLKQGWLRRNGVPESDQTTLVEHFIRHDKYLLHVAVITDPVYLAEPLIRTTDFALAVQDNASWLWPCEYVEEISGKSKSDVPSYLPGANPFIQEFLDRTGAPAQAARGGPETIYPEYQRSLTHDAAGAFSAAEAPRVSQAKNPDDGSIQVRRVQGNVYLFGGAGGNVAVQVGSSGSLMVDTKSATVADQMLDEIRKIALSSKPVRYILNTSADPDHIGGNASLAKALGSATSWQIINTPGASQSAAVQIIAHDKVLARMNKLPSIAWPTETFVGREKEFFFNGEPVFMYHVPAAHTDGDSIVFFRRSDVIATGDVFRTDSYPVIDLERGGSVQGVIDALNLVLDLAVPAHHEEGGTFIVPGHGRICDEFDVVEYRDMVTIVRDRIQDLVRKGMTLEQVKAARPTLDYDGRYGSSDVFIEAAYRELASTRKRLP
jgi:glyoxylase-like metal-dependent hydrolase (beta-lactamase superfamily II)